LEETSLSLLSLLSSESANTKEINVEYGLIILPFRNKHIHANKRKILWQSPE
jgi:hypothetical protein